MHQLQVGSLHPLAQDLDQPPVLFNGEHFASLGNQQLGQRPQARPDFQHAVAGLQRRLGDDAPQLILVVEKVLPEGFCELNPPLGQKLAHVGEFHRANTSARALTVARSCPREIVRGGVKPMTLAASPSGSRMKPR